MKILDSKNDLETYLKEVKGQKLTIITAFASDTERLIDTVLENNNEVDILVGTINSFSSPSFIDHCNSADRKNLSLHVDFRYHNSIHWKLYLIYPDMVIIGSANFTQTGVRLIRDTCVLIEDTCLYNEYIERVTNIFGADDVINSMNRSKFNSKLELYRKNHRRVQSGLARSKQYRAVSMWLDDDANQTLPLLIWEDRHSKNTIRKAHELIENNESDVTINRCISIRRLICLPKSLHL